MGSLVVRQGLGHSYRRGRIFLPLSSAHYSTSITTQGIARPVKKIDEENLPHYNATQYYPVRVGEILKSPCSTYEVVGKLGYGRNSTVWLCRSLGDRSFYTVKIETAGIKSREAKIYNHLSNIRTSHIGQRYVRTLHEAFEIKGPDGHHHCLVHAPLGMNMSEFQDTFPNKTLPADLLKTLLNILLHALDFLHTPAHVIHTDIQARNILLSLTDEAPLTNFINAEREQPCARNVIDERRTIYTSRVLDFSTGDPMLCDFGQAMVGEKHKGVIQPLPFRAPEVILRMEWNSKVDIWNLGVLVWNLFFDRFLFDGETEQEQLGEMIAYLGLPTLEFLKRSKIGREYFDDHGLWEGSAITSVCLEEIVEGEEKEVFLDFLRSMLRWAPEERKTAMELLEHPWLSEGDSGSNA